jgi:hypothetical protein
MKKAKGIWGRRARMLFSGEGIKKVPGLSQASKLSTLIRNAVGSSRNVLVGLQPHLDGEEPPGLRGNRFQYEVLDLLDDRLVAPGRRYLPGSLLRRRQDGVVRRRVEDGQVAQREQLGHQDFAAGHAVDHEVGEEFEVRGVGLVGEGQARRTADRGSVGQ